MDSDLALANLVRLRAGAPAAAARAAARYTSRFRTWDERASVRRRPARVLSAGGEHLVYFPPELLPVVSHPLVRQKGTAAIHGVLTHRLQTYLHFTSELEQIAVTPVVTSISRGRSGLCLPEQMRADAFKIVTDEAWHAQFSFDMMRQVERETGIGPVDTVPAFATRLDAIRRHLPAPVHGTQDLLFAVVSETLISAILSGIPDDQRLPAAVRDLVRDHAEDEGRHHAYFRAVLRCFWPALDTSIRQEIGPWLPEIIFAFLEPDYLAVGQSLRAIGLDVADVEQVLAESWPRWRVVRDVAGAAQPTIRYLAEVGALDDRRTLDAFAAAGLIGAGDPDG